MKKHAGMIISKYQQIVIKVLILSACSMLYGSVDCFAQTRKSGGSAGGAVSPGQPHSSVAKGSAAEAAKVQQRYGLDPQSALISRVRSTPADVIKQFHDAGMSPTAHLLTEAESKIVSKAIKALPPLHQTVMQQHLLSISFLDNMPNTALTSTITEGNGFRLFHITFRAGVLHQNISEWVTEKERSCYAGLDSSLTVTIEAGLLSALTYIMIHEGTHVVDASLGLLSIDSAKGYYSQTSFKEKFISLAWSAHTKIAWSFNDTIVNKNRYRVGGRQFQPAEAVRVYTTLSRSPFVSLYSTASWNEDLAELLTVYHLTTVLNQPFRIVVSQRGKEVYNSEIMQSPMVQSRLDLMKYFYSTLSGLKTS